MLDIVNELECHTVNVTTLHDFQAIKHWIAYAHAYKGLYLLVPVTDGL